MGRLYTIEIPNIVSAQVSNLWDDLNVQKYSSVPLNATLLHLRVGKRKGTLLHAF